MEAAERVRQQRLQEQKALELEIEQARYEVRRAANSGSSRQMKTLPEMVYDGDEDEDDTDGGYSAGRRKCRHPRVGG